MLMLEMRKFSFKLLFVASLYLLTFHASAYASGIKFSYTKVSAVHPCQNATETYSARVVNSAGHSVSGAKVTFKVYYKSTTTAYSAGNTDSSGKVAKKFKIGRATIGYKVAVKSRASKNGA